MNSRDRRLEAQAAWTAFCERLKTAGEQFLREDFPMDERDLAEGLRYLGRLTLTSIERHLDGADPSRPYFYPLCNERIKVGGDNPDNRYFAAAVSDRYAYRLRGDFGRCSYYSVVASGRGEIVKGVAKAALVTTGLLNSESMKTGPDGLTEIHLGREASGPNHLPLDERTNLIIVRCTIEEGDEREVPLSIERIDGQGDPQSPSFEQISAKLLEAAGHVRQASTFFGDWTAKFQAHLNELPLGDQPYIHSTGGDPNILYYLSAWACGPEEALVLRIPEIPPCKTWNLQLCNVWMESLDYTRGRIHLNSRTAVLDANGGVTIIAADKDAGHPNWIQTQGHRSGVMCMRLVGASRPAVVQSRLVPVESVRAEA